MTTAATLAASGLRLSPAVQPARQPPQSQSLGSLGVATRFMRVIVFTALGLLCAISSASAKSVIMIEIKTTRAAVAYSINNQPMTPTQLTEWMKNAIETYGDKETILILPAPQTTFATVFALLESLKACGVKHFEIITERSSTPSGLTIRSLTTNANQVKRDQFPALEPPK